MFLHNIGCRHSDNNLLDNVTKYLAIVTLVVFQPKWNACPVEVYLVCSLKDFPEIPVNFSGGVFANQPTQTPKRYWWADYQPQQPLH